MKTDSQIPVAVTEADDSRTEKREAGCAPAAGSELRCENCKFWKPDDEDDADNSAGICRRHPPTVNAVTWGCYIFLMKSTSSEWPEADAFDWCGEHTPNSY